MSYEIFIKKEKDINPKKDWREYSLVTTSIVNEFYYSGCKSDEKERERKFYQEMVDKGMIENEKEHVFYVKIVKDVVDAMSCNCSENNYIPILMIKYYYIKLL